MVSNSEVVETNIPGIPVRRGKVRDVYDLGDRLVLVATDRISAFDWVLPTPIPDKGKILTALSLFWFDKLDEPHHLISTDLAEMGSEFARRPEVFSGRSVLVQKTQVVPIECVVRGYLAGSGWKDYQVSGHVCGHALPAGLKQADRLPSPIFTPATKADVGHDENISDAEAIHRIGPRLFDELRLRSLRIFEKASEYARSRGIIIADTKFEFGRTPSGDILLIDEVLTPDSSRFWPVSGYRTDQSPPSFDKQYVRDWLESIQYDKSVPPPPLPREVVEKTRGKYLEAFERLTGRPFEV